MHKHNLFVWTANYLIPDYMARLASFPGPAQLSVACSTEKWWGEPGNEAMARLVPRLLLQSSF